MPDDPDNVVHFADRKSLFGEKYQQSEAPQDEGKSAEEKCNDEIARNINFTDVILGIIRIDFFSASSSSINEAKSHLQMSKVKNNLAAINVSFDRQPPNDADTQLKIGMLRDKRDEIYAIAKKLFNSNETYNKWRADIKDLENSSQS